MAKLITVPAGMTIFRGYLIPRMTKSKDKRAETNATYMPCWNEICSICKMRKGRHKNSECPSYQIMKFD